MVIVAVFSPVKTIVIAVFLHICGCVCTNCDCRDCCISICNGICPSCDCCDCCDRLNGIIGRNLIGRSGNTVSGQTSLETLLTILYWFYEQMINTNTDINTLVWQQHCILENHVLRIYRVYFYNGEHNIALLYCCFLNPWFSQDTTRSQLLRRTRCIGFSNWFKNVTKGAVNPLLSISIFENAQNLENKRWCQFLSLRKGHF